MIDIQQGTLRTFKHNALAFPAETVQLSGNIRHHRRNLLALRQRLVQHLLVINRRGLEIVFQRKVVVFHYLAQAFCKVRRIQQFAETQTASCNLVFIRRPDTTSGGTNGLFTPRQLARLVQRNMVRKNKRA